MDISNLLQTIEKNLDELKLKNQSLKLKNEALTSENSDLKIRIQDLENLQVTTEESAQPYSINSLTSEKSENVKLKIEGLIEEIDECLALLNN